MAKRTASARPRRLTPKQVRAERQRAEAHQALERGEVQRAAEILREVLRHLPGDLAARVGLAMALSQMGEVAEAEAQLDELARRFPRSNEAHLVAGELYETARQPASAARRYEAAAAFATSDADRAFALGRLALSLERLHRLDDSREAAKRAQRLAPAQQHAILAEGLLAAREGDHHEAQLLFREILEQEEATPFMRTRAAYERARALDRLGDYEEAMTTLSEIKSLQRADFAGLARRAAEINTRNEMLATDIAPDDFAPLLEADDDTRLALLVGFPRTGSTLLESALDRHPGLVAIEERPALPLAIVRPLARARRAGLGPLDILRSMTEAEARACRGRYLRLLEQFLGVPLDGRLALDKNPAYTHLLPFIKRLFPRAKTIVALRDPRDVVLSCYMMSSLELNEFNISFLDLEETARQYVRDMRIWLRYRDILGDDFVEVRYEDLVEDLGREVRRTVDYLGLEWTDEMLGYRQRAAERPAQSPTYADVTQPVYTRAVSRWRNYERWLEPVQPILEPMVKALGYA